MNYDYEGRPVNSSGLLPKPSTLKSYQLLYIAMKPSFQATRRKKNLTRKKNKKKMGGGTEAFPDLGRHCQLSDCHQLDFLPFTCHACHKVFCVDHRSCKSHECPKSDYNSRKVLVCELCSMSIETTGCKSSEEVKGILQKHEQSADCDPKKKKKPTCPVKRCKEVLTFSNSSTCKTCRIQVCLKHRFPADHACNRSSSSSQPLVKNLKEANNKFLTALVARTGNDCGNKNRASSPHPANHSVKAC